MTSTLFAPPTRERLAEQHPEWRPWLALLEVLADEASVAGWTEAAPGTADASAPVLAGCVLTIERAVVERCLRRLFTASGVEALAAATDRCDALAVLGAAVNLDEPRLTVLAGEAGAPASPFVAVATLAALPWLEACGRRLPAVESADRGWCPMCGAWPILAEARGLERERRLRCARCGGDWRTPWLTCPYCSMNDHTRLVSLVAEGAGDSRKIEGCRDCTGYVKTLTTLAAADAANLRLLDLSTVDLDVAALEHGYTQRSGLGHPLDVRVTERPARRFWRR